MAAVSEGTRKKLAHIPQELQREFPHVPVERIDELVDALSVRLLLAAHFDDFVPLLAHRRARERLLEESHAHSVG
jgi:phage terminase Nu1 subunit (DNA packaging protein)